MWKSVLGLGLLGGVGTAEVSLQVKNSFVLLYCTGGEGGLGRGKGMAH